MKTPILEITYTNDEHDCDTCGYDIAYGATAKIDDLVVYDVSPIAHCFASVNYDEIEMWKAIVKHLSPNIIIKHNTLHTED